MKINQQGWISRAELKNGASLNYRLHNKEYGVYLFVINGSITVEGQTLNRRDAIGMSAAEMVNITATADSDVLLLEVPMHI